MLSCPHSTKPRRSTREDDNKSTVIIMLLICSNAQLNLRCWVLRTAQLWKILWGRWLQGGQRRQTFSAEACCPVTRKHNSIVWYKLGRGDEATLWRRSTRMRQGRENVHTRQHFIKRVIRCLQHNITEEHLEYYSMCLVFGVECFVLITSSASELVSCSMIACLSVGL